MFNSTSRIAMFDSVRASRSPFANAIPLMRALYGVSTPLRSSHFDPPSGPLCVNGQQIFSCTGGRQGCTWGAKICSLALHPAVLQTSAYDPTSDAFGYVIDT